MDPAKTAIRVCVVEGESRDEASLMSLFEIGTGEVVVSTVNVVPATVVAIVTLLCLLTYMGLH